MKNLIFVTGCSIVVYKEPVELYPDYIYLQICIIMNGWVSGYINYDAVVIIMHLIMLRSQMLL